ncbi:unnamed protein product [Closterium sp. NIES-53]
MLVSVDAYAELTFDDEEVQERQEEYRQKVGSLQFAATTTRPDIAFACSKLGSDLTVRSDQQLREVDRCLAYLANTRYTALEFGGVAESLKLASYVDAEAGQLRGRRRRRRQAEPEEHERLRCVVATEAGKEGRRLCFLLAQFRQLDAGTPNVLRMDNKSAIMVTEGMGLTGNLKHMGVGTLLLGTSVRCSRRPTRLDDQAWLPSRPGYPGDVCEGCRGGFCEADLGGGIPRSMWLVGAVAGVDSAGRLRYARDEECTGVAGDRCDVAVDQGARQLQLTGLGNGWAIDQEGLFVREVDGAVRRPEK